MVIKVTEVIGDPRSDDVVIVVDSYGDMRVIVFVLIVRMEPYSAIC
jgi:hypothetical protein